jgi:hypothetical protein
MRQIQTKNRGITLFPPKHIQYLVTKINSHNLARPVWFDKTSIYNLQKFYNGIGSEKYSYLLKLTSEILSVFEPAALIHDLEWSSIGAVNGSTFEESNSTFRANCHIVASYTKPVIKIFRPTQRRIYHEIAEDLHKIVSGPIGKRVWKDSHS